MVSLHVHKMPSMIAVYVTSSSQAIKDMLNDGMIEFIDCSEWLHPMVRVFKKDGRIRICTDLQALNKQIVTEKFVLPSTC